MCGYEASGRDKRVGSCGYKASGRDKRVGLCVGTRLVGGTREWARVRVRG